MTRVLFCNGKTQLANRLLKLFCQLLSSQELLSEEQDTGPFQEVQLASRQVQWAQEGQNNLLQIFLA